MSDSGNWPWLKVFRQKTDLEFSMMIGDCLIRYFRGDSDNPNQMHLFRAEEMRKSFGLFQDDPEDAFNWFMILERDEQGRAVQVVFEQANSDGEVRNRWVAAQSNRAGGKGVVPLAKPPQDVGAPIVKTRSDETGLAEKAGK